MLAPCPHQRDCCKYVQEHCVWQNGFTIATVTSNHQLMGGEMVGKDTLEVEGIWAGSGEKDETGCKWRDGGR